ncbi:ArsR family transcriptional regulator [Roseiarcus fermentans]|uniref:ArsR family transcriptional regulator n=1 Tax=Roseiarcus fermentans TaxID=1473586 RepID=A0A366FRZ0_9HYPH|nr:metalloregulator ArsR/SmtB family transcription factor [Roseiarcus fermentans]RBP16499.1 ArsR family transcriptional regulator [Roseiarcus fermentans]
MSHVRSPSDGAVSFSSLLAGLEAAGEETRLRILCLLDEAELTVSELVAILGQSQPRVSRHLKLLTEAGLAVRQREGAWAFFRLAEAGGEFARDLVRRLDPADPVLAADRARLDVAREARRRQAAAYFAEQAGDWDRIRALHASEERVEAALIDLIGDRPFRTLLDLGTGTGRMLELLAPRAARAVGVDQSAAMLALARSRMEQTGLRNVQLRQGDVYAPPVERNGYDLIVVHQVLHFLDDPARALKEAARALGPSGRLVVVDFDAHTQEFLRADFAHRRLGFPLAEIEGFLTEAGLVAVRSNRVPPAPGDSGKLTVALWLAEDPRVISDGFQRADTEFA